MLSAALVRDVATFFYLALPDERMAANFTRQILRRTDTKDWSSATRESHGADLIKLCESLLVQRRPSPWRRKLFRFDEENLVQASASLNLMPWKELSQSLGPEYLIPLIWSRVLSFPEQQIALGEGISIGTLRHRLTRALRGLAISTGAGARV